MSAIPGETYPASADASRQGVPTLLDMDPGVDDALALMLAMRSPELDVKAITVCGGNISAERCAFNALKTLDALSATSPPPVAIGAWRPLRRSPWLRGGVHGDDGLGNVRDRYADPDRSRIDRRDGIDLILEMARSHGDRRDRSATCSSPLLIIATGPLTNVALAIRKDPEAMRRVERIVWMGGAYAVPGNVTSVAEFNAFFDPDAACEVFDFGLPITAVGLDVTYQCFLGRDQLRELIRADAHPSLQFTWDITQSYMDFYQANEGCDACCLHDPLAVGLAIWPDLITDRMMGSVEVICDPGSALGMTLVDRRRRGPWRSGICRAALDAVPAAEAAVLREAGLLTPAPNATIALNVDAPAFLRRFLERIG